MKNFIKEFMFISVGRPGINIRLSKFGAFIFTFLSIALGIIIADNTIKQVARRDKEIEKIYKEIRKLQEEIIPQLKEEIRKKDQELKELKEFKELIETIKKLSKNMMDDEQQEDLAMVIYKESQKYKFDWRMVLAIVMTESNFYTKAFGDGALGLMQLKYHTAKSAGERIGLDINRRKELYDIETNVSIGAFYLFEQIREFKDVKKAIMAYSLGPEKAKEYNERRRGRTMQTSYLKKVLSNYRYLKKKNF